MDIATTDYLKSLKPKIQDDWKALVEEGRMIGKDIPSVKNRFCEKYGYDNYMQFRKEMAEEGKMLWTLVVGRATLEEQIQAIKDVYEYVDSRGRNDVVFQCIPSPVNALPRELQDKAAKTTSYMLNGPEDWVAHKDAAPLDITFGDFHLSSPNAIETTINALKAGSSRVGELSQFIWKYPGFSDEYKRLCDVVRSLGIMSTQKDEFKAVETYLDDGIPGYFMDCVSYVAYALLEHHICTELCGARLSIGFGGLLGSVETRVGTALAIQKLLGNDEHLVLSYYNNSTHQHWDKDLVSNYAILCQECLMQIIAERHYKMGIQIDPVAITEKLQVPTLEEQLDVYEAGRRMEEFAPDIEKYIDFTMFDNIRDSMAGQGQIMYDNIIEGLTQAGIDTGDPLELLLFMQNINYGRFETIFHPSTYGRPGEDFKPFYPTALGKQTVEMRDEIIADLREKGFTDKTLAGKKIVLGSGDCHTYGLILVNSVLENMGANVVNGGVDITPAVLLDLADEESTKYVCVSVHNGQGLDYGKQLLELARERGREYSIFMGGKLNGILPGHSVPSDIDGMLRDLGVHATNDFEEILNILSKI